MANEEDDAAIKAGAVEVVSILKDLMQRMVGEMAAIGRWLLATLVLLNGAGAVATLSAPVSVRAMPVAGFGFIAGILCALAAAFLSVYVYRRVLTPLGALIGYYLTVVVDGERLEPFEKQLLGDAEKAATDWRLWLLGGLAVAFFLLGATTIAFGLEAKPDSAATVTVARVCPDYGSHIPADANELTRTTYNCVENNAAFYAKGSDTPDALSKAVIAKCQGLLIRYLEQEAGKAGEKPDYSGALEGWRQHTLPIIAEARARACYD